MNIFYLYLYLYAEQCLNMIFLSKMILYVTKCLSEIWSTDWLNSWFVSWLCDMCMIFHARFHVQGWVEGVWPIAIAAFNYMEIGWCHISHTANYYLYFVRQRPPLSLMLQFDFQTYHISYHKTISHTFKQPLLILAYISAMVSLTSLVESCAALASCGGKRRS